VDFNAVTGANVVNNYAGGLLKATDADAVNGVVNNAGTIKAVNAKADGDGIDAQANTGVQVFNLPGPDRRRPPRHYRRPGQRDVQLHHQRE
jgi:hypothetical protein